MSISKKIKTNETVILKYVKAIPEAFAPIKGSFKAAGYDLKSAFNYVIPPNGKELIDTGIKIELPAECYGRIASKSSLSKNHSIEVGGMYHIYSP